MVNSPFLRKNDLKKSKPILIFILSILLFSAAISTSLARQSTSVEVKEGESYKWVIKLNFSNYIELMSNTGDGTVPTELVALNLQGNDNELMAVDLILEIHDTSDGFSVDSYFNVMISLFEGTLGVTPDYNISQIPIFFPLNFSIKPTLTSTNFSILKADTPDYFSTLSSFNDGYSYPKGTYQPFLFIVPTDLDWTTAAAELQTEILSHFRTNYGIVDGSVTPQGKGLRISMPADTTLLATELDLAYNTKGVLETASGKYGGATLFSLELVSDGTIAFELPLFLIISTIAIAILLVRKRKKYTLK
ncbi:hypothetical protein LCGC14_1428650 [marine sediment metagenome]|uniref:Uncharacterized protein n=1 Tax=marine sediment metagenome TaxID=412755 RepID=A0A0F9JPJ9_9ZZZZ